ncbi:MAG: damage-inducible protein DinB [Acidobacteria bacterium]|nr:damage-inducible protein DinB [Acidobacteriota bacterium]
MSNNLAAALIGELQQEAATTRKCLERIPADKFDYKPHEKSMAMGRLAVHTAEMVDWAKETVTTTELDFAANEYKPFEPKTTEELVEFADKHLAEAIEALKNTSDEAMMENWTLRNGETVYFTMPRIQVLRGMVFNHIIHHRGQLSVYMRLNDIPVPAIYGPSADEGAM